MVVVTSACAVSGNGSVAVQYCGEKPDDVRRGVSAARRLSGTPAATLYALASSRLMMKPHLAKKRSEIMSRRGRAGELENV